MKVRSLTMTDEALTSIGARIAATTDTAIRRIVVAGALIGVLSIRLSPDQSLDGEDGDTSVGFAPVRRGHAD